MVGMEVEIETCLTNPTEGSTPLRDSESLNMQQLAVAPTGRVAEVSSTESDTGSIEMEEEQVVQCPTVMTMPTVLEEFPSSCNKDECLPPSPSHQANYAWDPREIPTYIHDTDYVYTIFTPYDLLAEEETPAVVMDADTPSSIKQRVSSEPETDSTSCYSESPDDEDELYEARMKWEIERSEVKWKWHWLQLQCNYLSQELQRCESDLHKSTESKEKVSPNDVKAEHGAHSIRTVPLIRPTSRKIYIIDDRPFASEGEDNHPLLSRGYSAEKKRKELVEAAVKKYRREKQRKIAHDTSPSESLMARLAARKKDKSSADSSPKISICTASTFEEKKSPSSNRARSHLRTRDFDINNIVVPCDPSSVVTPKQTKPQEILTPCWAVYESEDVDIPIDILDSSSEEDTSDEMYAKLHFPKELQERRRYLSNKNFLPLLSGLFPNEIQSTEELLSTCTDNDPVLPQTADVTDKIEHKFKAIRERYVGSYKWKRRKLDDTYSNVNDSDDSPPSSDLETYLDNLFYELKKNKSAIKWEVVHRDPIINPITNKPRNLILLRRVVSTPMLRPQRRTNNLVARIPSSPQLKLSASTSILLKSDDSFVDIMDLDDTKDTLL